MADDVLPAVSVAEHLADKIVALQGTELPDAVHELAERLLIDVVGLCLVARKTDYVSAARAAWGDPGRCSIVGQDGAHSAASAAFVNGTAAHGEDFDDTFEGGPVHAGAVIIPAVLAAAEDKDRSGQDVLLGIAVGVETICRLGLVIPKAVHKAGFHPTAVFGTMAAAAAVSATLGANRRQTVDSLGIAGSMAGGIIEYLAEGTWTKRMHPGWAAQSGLRAAYLGISGFAGPRTVFEGVHGLFNGFANRRDGEWGNLLDGFGTRWVTPDLAFKPYPCGTMTHPYIDCAIRLRAHGIDLSQIAAITCEVAEGTVHRLWEPLAAKRAPSNGYAAKFSQPYCIAAALVHGEVGLGHFTDEAVRDDAVRALAAKIGYVIDPKNPYPHGYTGHVRLTFADGSVIEERQPHLRGGRLEPLSRADIEAKFRINAQLGGWGTGAITDALAAMRGGFARPLNFVSFRT